MNSATVNVAHGFNSSLPALGTCLLACRLQTLCSCQELSLQLYLLHAMHACMSASS